MPTRQLFQTIPPPNSAPGLSVSKSNNKTLILGLAIGGGGGALIFLVAFFLVLYRKLRGSKTSPYEASTVKLQKFAYRELKLATENFNPTQRLGQGGFGVVYKGTLKNGKDVAVKKLDTTSLQGEREFQNEVSVIGRVNSPHIVSLLGYCVDGKKRLLVYEYMENGSLQEALFDEMYAASLDWNTRFKILLDTARGLAFLHYKCDPPIIHGDVKPSNILLDKHFCARIADFGLARLKSEETGPAVRSEEVEREHMERERIRYERIERERARRALRRREEAERKKAMGMAASPDVKSSDASPDKKSDASPEKRWEGTLEKSPLGRMDESSSMAASPKQSDYLKELTIAVDSSPAPSVQESIVPDEPAGADNYAAQGSPPTTVADEEVHQAEFSRSVQQSPLSMQPSPSIAESSPSVQHDSPIREFLSPASNNGEIGEVVVASSEAGSPEEVKIDMSATFSPPVETDCSTSSKQVAKEDEVVFHVPDASVKEETEPEGWSTISPSEGYRDDVSVESGGKELHLGTSGIYKERRLWSRDWWWRQDTTSGELTIKDFINWTPKSAPSESKRKSPGSIRDWAGFHDSSGSVTPVSESRRFENKKKLELKRNHSRSSIGSDGGWGEFSGELTGGKKKEGKRDKDKYTMREWWKEDGDVGKSKRELAKSKSRDSSKLGKTKSREWWREEFSGDLGKNKVPKSGPLLSLSREGSRREKNKSREWWREENSGELSRTNSSRHVRHSGELKKERTREKSRSRDWFSGDLLGRAAVSSTPSMRGTICYVAPEYGGGGILSEKSDVYSFGVLMLVIISGRRPLQVMASPIVEFERANLISWARHLAQSGNVLDLVDGMLQGQYSKEQAVLCITVALLCLQRLPAVRPTMGEVVKILLGESDLPSLPFEFSPSPPYFLSRRKPSVERVAAVSTASETPLLA
ncbi:protein MpRLK-Pelle_RLCK-XI [Marchantia polymorpha subsp. ruderalis]|uniref:non-specific serine/threonine protein kinase n=2 Tax=Marchantia polymorpha TaxID=3197 RepID=A0AAF6B219_MARPO|nr:hypothetical protein MARPO_0140s0042 [Marchantia polymorpha]BBN06053.1 hypothetical protein Mp_3g17990 [Marchantia polymorpha subsp. ruderalis]|eukprot:PTQ29514.1 hypothetical protein MARPO_0140s0042 [Marchantia polymorpha]